MERGMMMRRGYDEMGEIKKGPWKAEEDEVLINHVKRYGPRDWSSIRSKGFLQRTGKSCRLRWVNKLRPNLKNGVKFSAEEERVVIELQGEFGNKWARIATYLPGRTDNDVKNFWSSRQKRLARILQNPPPPQPKSHKNPKTSPSLHVNPTLEAPKLSSSPDGDAESSSNVGNAAPINMLPLPEFMNPPCLLNFDPSLIQLEFIPMEKTVNTDPQQPQLSFPPIPPLQTDLPLPLESHELFTRLGDPSFFSVFGQVNASDIGQLPYASPDIETERSTVNGGRGGEIENPATPDSFIDDFPIDMFDHIEPLPSPSDW